MSQRDEPNVSSTIFTSLNSLVMNGIELDKNLRQPSYYSCINSNELKAETFGIISDLLSNQRIPVWLSQRIAWYYADKYLDEIINDLTHLNNNSKEIDNIDFVDSTEPKKFAREKLVVYLRNSISKIIKDWQLKKCSQNRQNLLFSFSRYENNSTNNIKFNEFGIKNKRRIMEDRITVIENTDLFQKLNGSLDKTKLKPSAVFGIFDGHCGVDCAQYVSKHLPMFMIQHPEFYRENSNLQNVFLESFQSINERFTAKAKKESLRSGSTACVAILSKDPAKENAFTALDLAWCGDSRLGLIKNGQLTFLTSEHKPDDEAERSRITKAGGNVSFVSNAWRIDNSLAVSRSFGDIDYQPSVISLPETKHFDLDGTEDYLIIGCDGLWDTLDRNELTTFIYEHIMANSEQNLNIAELLVRKAQDNGSSDNITAIFVLLKDNYNLITKPC